MTELVLSLFPGIGLFDRGFEQAGFAVTRGPDPLWGGDIRNFHVPAGKFFGVIGGPPCQKFSLVNRNRDTAGGMELVNEFLRVVDEAQPEFAVMENVFGSPAVTHRGYAVQVFHLNAREVGSDQNRPRKFHFFHRPGTPELVLKSDTPGCDVPECDSPARACLASEGKRANRRAWSEFCRLQGLPPGFDLPGFKVEEKFRAVGNGVPFEMACAIANAVRSAITHNVTPHRVCECGCGAFVTGRERLAGVACRKRMQRKRDASIVGKPDFQLEFS